MSEPDYFQMAKDITHLYITSLKQTYIQGKIDGGAEVRAIVDKVIGEKK